MRSSSTAGTPFAGRHLAPPPSPCRGVDQVQGPHLSPGGGMAADRGKGGRSHCPRENARIQRVVWVRPPPHFCRPRFFDLAPPPSSHPLPPSSSPQCLAPPNGSAYCCSTCAPRPRPACRCEREGQRRGACMAMGGGGSAAAPPAARPSPAFFCRATGGHGQRLCAPACHVRAPAATRWTPGTTTRVHQKICCAGAMGVSVRPPPRQRPSGTHAVVAVARVAAGSAALSRKGWLAQRAVRGARAPMTLPRKKRAASARSRLAPPPTPRPPPPPSATRRPMPAARPRWTTS